MWGPLRHGSRYTPKIDQAYNFVPLVESIMKEHLKNSHLLTTDGFDKRAADLEFGLIRFISTYPKAR